MSLARSSVAWAGSHRHGLVTAVVGVIGLLLPFWVDEYWLSTLVFIVIAALGALGLEVLTGRTGQLSLGHAFFLSAGAYTGGLLGANLHMNAALWIPAAGVVAGVLGAITAPTASRLRGPYLAIVTIGLVYIGQDIATNVSTLSGGPGGRALPVPDLGPLDFTKGLTIGGLFINENGLYYYLGLVLLALGMLYVRNLGRSRLGRNMAAVRDRELAAAVLGVNVAWTKTTAFVVSSVMAGVAGALYGSFLGFVTPGQFDLLLSIQYVIIIVVGGMGSIWGPILGAIFVVGLPALLQNEVQSIPFLAGGTKTSGIPVTDASAIVYGLLLIVFLLFEPRGVVGLASKVGSLVRRRRAIRRDQGAAQLLTKEAQPEHA
jgi:branched-chain amino acid transport system permease protein